jgi:hypothetical protein
MPAAQPQQSRNRLGGIIMRIKTQIQMIITLSVMCIFTEASELTAACCLTCGLTDKINVSRSECVSDKDQAESGQSDTAAELHVIIDKGRKLKVSDEVANVLRSLVEGKPDSASSDFRGGHGKYMVVINGIEYALHEDSLASNAPYGPGRPSSGTHYWSCKGIQRLVLNALEH